MVVANECHGRYLVLCRVYHRLDIFAQIEATVQEWKSLLKSRKEVVEMESFETALEEPLADIEGWRW